MTYLAKLQFKSIPKTHDRDFRQERRSKFMAALEEQRLALAAAMKGQVFTKPGKPKNGEATEKAVRRWFFERDGGFYLQPRYGARLLLIDGKSNAVFVAKQADLDAALVSLIEATRAGELDSVLEFAGRRGAGSKA